jgi:transposase
MVDKLWTVLWISWAQIMANPPPFKALSTWRRNRRRRFPKATRAASDPPRRDRLFLHARRGSVLIVSKNKRLGRKPAGAGFNIVFFYIYIELIV